MKHPAIHSWLPALAVTAIITFTPRPVQATGDYEEQPLTPLSDLLQLDQLPFKTVQQIHDEIGKPAPKAENVDVEKEATAFKAMTPAQVVARIDQLVLQARATQDTPTLNLLNDLRDLHAGPANAAEIADYLAWRTAKADHDADEIVARLDKAPPALVPHYLYLRGAAFYHAQEKKDAKERFEKILKEYPTHPRAEVAQFMAARCELGLSRISDDEKPKATEPDHRALAKKLLEDYMAKYPKGRFAGDALGWLGAWYWDGDDIYTALKCYLGQLDIPDHPELMSSAVKMCEKILTFSATDPKAEDLVAIARNPAAAQALVYLVVNTAVVNGADEKVEDVKAWRKKVLPEISKAIAGQEALYKNATWRPRYLSILALAASGDGNQEEALKLLDTAGADSQTDDLLLARGVVCQRAKRSAEAVTAFRALLDKFPASPLVRGAQLRLGIALADDHRAGEAVLELDPLLPKDPNARPPDPPSTGYDETGVYPTYADIPGHEVAQLIDLWLNFAPIAELAAPAAASGLDPVKRLRLTEPIAERLLAREQFDEAKKYMTPAQYDLVAGPLEKLTAAAKSAKDPAAHAASCLALGDAWAAARGKLLTYPLDTDEHRTRTYSQGAAEANSDRLKAAAVLGYTGNLALELENRDELRHAFNWWLESSDARRGAATTSTAIWRALRAMPLIANVSQFTFDRAIERNWTETAHKLDSRLRTECPASVEAKRYSIPWNFSEPVQTHPYTDEGDFILGMLDITDHEWQGDRDETERLKSLVDQAGTASQAELKASAEKFRNEAKPKFRDAYGARWVNCFDDLASFFSVPNVPGDVRAGYVTLRAWFHDRSAVGSDGYRDDATEKTEHPDVTLQKDIAAALADPQTKPVADFYEFLNLAVIANHFVFRKLENVPKTQEADVLEEKHLNTYRTRDYPLLAAKTRAFLEKYPKSRKREAALLLEARAMFRASEAVPVDVPASWPQVPTWKGDTLTTLIQQVPFDAKRVRAALDAYDREFPKGRYAADIRDYRADLMPLIKARPAAREWLLKYISNVGYSHPLCFMTAWLHEQLGSAPSKTAQPKS